MNSLNPYQKINGLSKSSKIMLGKSLEIAERTLIPIIELITYSLCNESQNPKMNLALIGYTLETLAFIIIEKGEKWVLPIRSNTYDLEYYLEKFPDLNQKL
ncbi:hypothetical protein GF319_01270 [Candidatus Bathyarchaeota archaeon]|jgi:hypothetical protein|nr:hypothetical protein [Candidatus Bathyarchaeota archaeon]